MGLELWSILQTVTIFLSSCFYGNIEIMEMKNWFFSKSYLIRGSIVGTIISLFLSLLFFLCVVNIEGVAGTVCLFLLWPGVLVYWRFEEIFRFNFGESYLIWINIIHFIILTAVGALIGWMVGKVKSKK